MSEWAKKSLRKFEDFQAEYEAGFSACLHLSAIGDRAKADVVIWAAELKRSFEAESALSILAIGTSR